MIQEPLSALAPWLLAAGCALLVMAFAGSLVERLPLSPAVVYLAIGLALGPLGVGMIDLGFAGDAPLIAAIAEIGVIISLFSVGLRLRVPIGDAAWRVPVRLAAPGLVITVAAASAVGITVFDLDIAAAIVLAAIVASTDPVLASDVRIEDPEERDRVRLGLTAEGGLNDGLVAAGVLLGLGLAKGHSFVTLAVWDFLWPLAAGGAIGCLCGVAVGKLVLALRRRRSEGEGLEEFLLLGLIGLAYGATALAHGEGLLAVFTAGLALRWVERRATESAAAKRTGQKGEGKPAALARDLLELNTQIERLAEVVVVVLAGALLASVTFAPMSVLFAATLLLVIRPVAVWLALLGVALPRHDRRLLQWFGVRGISAVFWLAFAITHGLPPQHVDVVASAALAVVAGSIVAHGVSGTPLMMWHGRKGKARRAAS
jgi:NhaP-type Na+/H+ or K+/H+ antiporter